MSESRENEKEGSDERQAVQCEDRAIGILKEADCKTIRISELCREHGRVSESEASKLKDLEKENSRPKRLADKDALSADRTAT